MELENGSRAVRVFAVLASLALGGVLLHLGRSLLLPLLVAAMICVAFTPLVAALEHRKIPWWLTVGGVLLVLLGALSWGGALLYGNARDAWKNADLGAQAPASPAGATADARDEAPPDDPRREQAAYEEFSGEFGKAVSGLLEGRPPSEVIDALKRTAPSLARYLLQGAVALFGAINDILLVLVYVAMMFAERRLSRRKIERAAGDRAADVNAVLEAITRDVGRYLSMRTLLCLGAAVPCGIALALLGVPYAALFGLLTFLLGFIPNFGAVLAAVPPVLVALWAGDGYATAIWVASVYVVVNTIIGTFLEPVVLGRQMNLSPLVVIVAVLFWTQLWGFAGLVLGIPLTRTVQIICSHVRGLESVAVLLSNGVGDAGGAKAR